MNLAYLIIELKRYPSYGIDKLGHHVLELMIPDTSPPSRHFVGGFPETGWRVKRIIGLR